MPQLCGPYVGETPGFGMETSASPRGWTRRGVPSLLIFMCAPFPTTLRFQSKPQSKSKLLFQKPLSSREWLGGLLSCRKGDFRVSCRLPGICRGIDVEKRLYHILTPLPPEELRNVNCLLVGAISIPQCVLKSQVGVAPRGQPWRKLAVGVMGGGA